MAKCRNNECGRSLERNPFRSDAELCQFCIIDALLEGQAAWIKCLG